MPEQDDDTAELDEAEVVLRMIFPAGDEAAKVLQPREQTLDLPPTAVAAEGAAILGHMAAVRAVRGDQLHPSLPLQPPVQAIAVIRPIPDQARGRRRRHDGVEGRLDERDFMRRSTCNGYRDRKTSAVCDRHELGSLAPLGLPDEGAPFFAPAKVPSMKHSLRSSWPRASRSRASASSSRSIVPLSTQY